MLQFDNFHWQILFRNTRKFINPNESTIRVLRNDIYVYVHSKLYQRFSIPMTCFSPPIACGISWHWSHYNRHFQHRRCNDLSDFVNVDWPAEEDLCSMNKYDTHLRTKLVVGKWLWSQLLATRGHLGDSAFPLACTQFGIVASNYQTSFFRVLVDNSQFETLKKRNAVADQRNVLQTGEWWSFGDDE